MPEQPFATALDPRFEGALRECLIGLVGPDGVLQHDTDLAALGIDSLTVVRLMVTIEDTFEVTIPDDLIGFEIFSSPGVLWDVVSGLLEESDAG
ncbi:phosphopantetheine-binding protein [Cellulomonas xiejunii]|uniref:Phosphopantetheine-binding protein n=1 Tax=Cellulomonas xiejunii TaxID=2968083 RepID=A0ABY5KPY8_9CELL|nr:phosphopantetheine-binding protein [Cellulomonas xiejunii]MCC2321242.1 phosphopantetheine-binding protein [Cellulomonas xiejunii]UUI71829.1 phosphopantetheine-binding protein [Cellulomonas xiejunii]